MGWFDDLAKGARLRGVAPSGPVTVIDVDRLGPDAVNLTYEDANGHVHRELVYRTSDVSVADAAGEQPWSFDADPELFLLAAEAKRISLAYLFDPFLATHSSDVDLLPHQIEAVYLEMLPRSPLRFLLADDPGAGKTIMAGLLIKELIVRGDLERCLIVVPGGLAEQWYEELIDKFGLEFELLTRHMIESTRSANPFTTRPHLIARLDMLARDEALQTYLDRTDWDLVVVDEAHKMSATHRGNDIEATKRYRLGQRLEPVARHFLLMTATPHNGKAEDFQLFMALLDGDRFAGKFRRGAHSDQPPTDLMRRRIKEDLLRFDGTKLFPDRVATTAKYPLSPAEYYLYEEVTAYVREGMNRAQLLREEGEGRRSSVVGFALTILQRRLASSPRAILRSLERRRGRLSARLAEAEMLGAHGNTASRRSDAPVVDALGREPAGYNLADFEDFDPDELLSSEVETVETEILDEATAARTAEELRIEIAQLEKLEEQARDVHARGEDRKWDELARLLQNTPQMLDEGGHLKKLIVFTEHRDTLDYLVERLQQMLGSRKAVVSIHGGVRREDRRHVQQHFTQDECVRILVATDAAGEGLNLQRAHLMVNYDLPWNPNRIEQRFGRIHRIGQTEVCRLWNLVADGTREGSVFERLLDKLEEQRRALGGKVFDVLGQAFSGKSLRDLLIEAITSANPELHRMRMNETIDATVSGRVQELIDEHSLLAEELAPESVAEIRDEMARARSMRLLPSFVRRFFLASFALVGGRATVQEGDRYRIQRVPATLRSWDKAHGDGRLLDSYERVCFERHRIAVAGKPDADLLAPGHPLLDAAVGSVLESHGSLLAQGSILIDPTDPGEQPRVLVFLEHEIINGRPAVGGARRPVSKRFEYVEITEDSAISDPGTHPYLDCRTPTAGELQLLKPLATADWVGDDLERQAILHAVQHNVPDHLRKVEERVHDRVDRTWAAVEQRLTAERDYWNTQVLKLTDDVLAGKRNARLNSDRARRRADEAADRLERRKRELALERKLSALSPRVIGAAFVVPEGLLARLAGEDVPASHAIDTARTERLAVDAVLAAERSLGRKPVEMPHNHKGYDIETRLPGGDLTFIEVKGRVAGAEDFVITNSEIIAGLNNAERHILALVEIANDDTTTVRYLHDPCTGRLAEPSYGEQKRVLSWPDYWAVAGPPS